MSSTFQLTLKLNPVQCLFLTRWNIAAQGNIVKESQREGQLCVEPNGVRRTVLIWYGVSCILIVENDHLYFIVSDGEQVMRWQIKTN